MKVYSYRLKERTSNSSKPSRSGRPKWNFKLPFKLKRPKNLWTLVFRMFALGVLFVALLFLYYAKDLPNPNKLLNREVPESTKIFDREGGLLYEVHGEFKRTLVGLDQIPEYAQKATIAIEDKDFYKHHGISITGILRSMLRYVVNLGPSGGGGSTLTQQFVKNAILTNKDGIFGRKIPEAILSISIEAKFSKDEILKLYLNEIPYGRNAYGIEAAAQSYFNKSAKDLTLAESAYLAALPQSPTRYNPFGSHRDTLDKRKDTVLSAMREQGYITEEQEKQAKEEVVQFIKPTAGIKAPHFVLMVQDYLASKYGEKTLEEGGLKVYTTLDPKLQSIAEMAVAEGVKNNEAKYNGHNAALVAIDPKSGQILAMVGSKDYFSDPLPEGCTPGKTCWFEPNVNAALSQLQPGSSFKPYVYVTAFGPEFKYSPATMLMDVMTNFGTYNGKNYAPGNYDGKERGPVSMRSALAGSLNIPAVKTLDLVGVNKAVETARALGITSPLADCGLSLVLGGCEVRLLDHVAAYSVLANGGIRNEKTAILKILDKNGSTLEEFKEDSKEVLNSQAVYQLVSIMTDNNARAYVFGANSPLILSGRPVAAKTGTTQNWHDGWTLGFTPSLAAGVWAGNNNGDLLKKGADGVFVAAPIWHQFMQEALKDKPVENFEQPSGVVRIAVDSISGKLPTANTPSTKEEVFADYNIPTDYDNVHVTAAMDSLTGMPATSDTPPERIIYKSFTVIHSEKPENPNWENPVEDWALKNGYSYPPEGALISSPGEAGDIDLTITQPSDNALITQSPFNLSAEAKSPNTIVRMDLFLDGQFYQSISSNPANFVIAQNLSSGIHTLAVKAVDNQNKSGYATIAINFGSLDTLTLKEPGHDSLAVFPLTLVAESGKKYEDVSFYFETANGNELIGKPEKTDNINGRQVYSLIWKDKPSSKTFYVFAKTDGGIETKKVKITIP